MPFLTQHRIDNYCAYIHLHRTKHTTSFSDNSNNALCTVENTSSCQMVVNGFVHEIPSMIYCRQGKHSHALQTDTVFVQKHLTGTFTHSSKENCITFSAITIPQNTAKTIHMSFRNASDR